MTNVHQSILEYYWNSTSLSLLLVKILPPSSWALLEMIYAQAAPVLWPTQIPCLALNIYQVLCPVGSCLVTRLLSKSKNSGLVWKIYPKEKKLNCDQEIPCLALNNQHLSSPLSLVTRFWSKTKIKSGFVRKINLKDKKLNCDQEMMPKASPATFAKPSVSSWIHTSYLSYFLHICKFLSKFSPQKVRKLRQYWFCNKTA